MVVATLFLQRYQVIPGMKTTFYKFMIFTISPIEMKLVH